MRAHGAEGLQPPSASSLACPWSDGTELKVEVLGDLAERARRLAGLSKCLLPPDGPAQRRLRSASARARRMGESRKNE